MMLDMTPSKPFRSAVSAPEMTSFSLDRQSRAARPAKAFAERARELLVDVGDRLLERGGGDAEVSV
jgi:hypothetical protein